MLLNQSWCQVLFSGPKTLVEHLYVEVGGQVIWESLKEQLLGVSIDKDMKFHAHLETLCKKAGAKVTALGRLSRVTPMGKKKVLMNAFINSQFSYCPLIWTFCSRELNDKMNRIHKRGLRLVYLDYTSSFEDLLKKDNSVTVHQRNIQLLAIEMFKVVRGLATKIMMDLFLFNLNTKNDKRFIRPSVNSVWNGENSVRYFGPVVWDDMVPAKLKSIQTLEKFKTEVKTWIPTCNCNLCKTYIRGVGFVETFE